MILVKTLALCLLASSGLVIWLAIELMLAERKIRRLRHQIAQKEKHEQESSYSSLQDQVDVKKITRLGAPDRRRDPGVYREFEKDIPAFLRPQAD